MSQSPKNVLFPFKGEDIGGSHVSAVGLIRGLNRDLWRPVVAVSQGGGSLESLLREHGIGWIEAPTMPRSGGIGADNRVRRLAAFLRCTGRLVRFLRANDIAIVHTNDGDMHAAWSLPARLAGAHHVWHHRGDPEARGVNLFAPLLASHIICVSDFAKPAFPILPVSRKLSVIHSPFDHPTNPPNREAARRTVLQRLDLPRHTRILAFFGNLIERKRPRVFIDAVNAFHRVHPDIPVVGLIFGVPVEDATADRTAEAYARGLGIGDRIRFMGYQSPVDVWMSATDILLVPSVREPFGRTLIEAMLLGTPVVATTSGGNSEAIIDGVNGVLVPPDDPHAFVEPVYRLLSDPTQWTRIAESARDRALLRFSAATHVGSISDLYASLVPLHTEAGRVLTGPQVRSSS